ncbi:VWA domain-containing protein [Terriglobus roseus]|uniref:VWA domain-containing protein n=1 Tax=Terriglobus roseus TaxID=392734 RepID=UPI001480DC7D|nr:VWA domain-containing protein [Terriglobus roseus]
MRLCLTLLCALAFTAALAAQTPAPKATGPADTIRTGAQIVILDVNVNGPDGAPVRHLKAGDFTVLENGAAQQVQHFEEHGDTAAGTPMPKMPRLPPGTYTNYSVVPEDGPLNVLLLDTLNTPTTDQMRVRQLMISFLKNSPPNRHVAIFGLSTRLYLLQGFTSNPALLQAALGRKSHDGQTSPLLAEPLGTDTVSDQMADSFGNNPGAASVIANVQQFEAIVATEQIRNRVLLTLTAINQLARYLNGLPGRKNLIWMSGSFPLNVLPDGDLPNPFAAALSMEDSFRETTNLLTRSQVAVYPVDARGLFAPPMFDASIAGGKYARDPTRMSKDMQKFSTSTFEEHSTMQAMADATGGKAYINTNDLAGAADSALRAGSNYYTLVYSPTNHNWNGGYRKIVVRTTSGTKYTLSYRHGYYADDPSRKTLDHDSTAATKSAAATIDPMSAAMQRGAPDPTQILFKAKIVPVEGTADKLTVGSVAAAKAKPPYRTFNVFLAASADDFQFALQPDGNRSSRVHLATVVYAPDGQPMTLLSQDKQAAISPAEYKQMLETGVKLQEQISVPLKGDYFLRIGLKDDLSGKVGAIEIPVSVIPGTRAK